MDGPDYNALPRKKSMATIDFTNGQIFNDAIFAFAPVTNVSPAIATSIHAATLYTRIETRFWGPAYRVTRRTSNPMKQSVRPSAIHSMVMILLLSPEIVPKPEMTDFVGTKWAMPHSVITMEPMDTNTYLVIISIPPERFTGIGA
jgi:hypothetical protein